MIFDPFVKSQLNNEFNFYYDILINSIPSENLSDLKIEFNSYLLSDVPSNNNIDLIDFWSSSKNSYPLLSNIAIDYLCIATNSIDAERSFSKLRHIQDSTRSSLSVETLSMEMIMYFNGDIEGKLNY
jgi:hypothetical protein